MRFLIDAQLPPQLGRFCVNSSELSHFTSETCRCAMRPIRRFSRGCGEDAVVVTKDSDFVELVHRLGPPPRVLWVTCGNVTNRHFQRLFGATFTDALKLFEAGESIVEIADAA